MKRSTNAFSGKRGDIYSLDTIYTIQGLGGGKWWKHRDDDVFSEHIELVCDVEINVTVKLGDNLGSSDVE
jgi:hypothetical protein